MSIRQLVPAAVLSLLVAVVAAATRAAPAITGSSCEVVMGSEVCTWVVIQEGAPLELGVTVPMALIESVPDDVDMVWPPREMASIAFPHEARTALGFDHLTLNWEAHGHPPMTFLTPHFDFHFYTVSEADVASIDCSDESKPEGLPVSYALPDVDVPGMGRLVGLCVPHMGMHAMPAEEVHHDGPFGASMLVGYYGAAPIFIEPMVSREVLFAREGFTLPVPRVAGVPDGVRYPRAFRADYDAATAQYSLVFSGF